MSKEDKSLKKSLLLLGTTLTVGTVFAAAASLGGLSDEGLDSKAADTLRKNGFDPVEVGGYGWFDCADAGIFSTRFEAVNAQGQEVSGSVCDGPLAASSIRLD